MFQDAVLRPLCAQGFVAASREGVCLSGRDIAARIPVDYLFRLHAVGVHDIARISVWFKVAQTL